MQFFSIWFCKTPSYDRNIFIFKCLIKQYLVYLYSNYVFFFNHPVELYSWGLLPNYFINKFPVFELWHPTIHRRHFLLKRKVLIWIVFRNQRRLNALNEKCLGRVSRGPEKRGNCRYIFDSIPYVQKELGTSIIYNRKIWTFIFGHISVFVHEVAQRTFALACK